MAENDIYNSGFFHLCEEIHNEKSDKMNPKMQYWKKRQENLKTLLENNSVPFPHARAINNSIGIFMFLTQGEENEARDHFKELLEDGTGGINTIANYLSICKALKKEGEDSFIESLERRLQHALNSDHLEQARAICERGYFQLYKYDEQIQSLEQAEKAAKCLEVGIAEGSNQGMSQEELVVWKYYLSDATRKVFDFAAMQDYETDCQIEAFQKMVDCFQDFYFLASEEHVFFKSRAVVDVIQTITTSEAVATSLPNFETLCQETILGDLWEDYYVSLEEALEMSSNDYRIPARIAKVYCRKDRFEEALKYTEISLNMYDDDCFSSKHTRLIAYAHLSREAHLKKDFSVADEYLLLAYKEGKSIKNSIMSPSGAAEMAKVCYHLSVDKTVLVWTLRRDRVKYLEEAISYNKMAINTFPVQPRPRAHRQLSDCYWMQQKYEESLEYLRKSLEFSLADKYIANLKCLLSKYRFFLSMKKVNHQKKTEAALQAANDLIKAWELLHATSLEEQFRETFLFFMKKLSWQQMMTKAILKGVHQQDLSDGKKILKGFCSWLQDEDVPEWLKNTSQEISKD